MERQSWQAIEEADVILFLLDGRAGVTPSDEGLAEQDSKLLSFVLDAGKGLGTCC